MKTMQAEAQTDAMVKPWYSHRWPWLLMIGPVAVIVAGIATTWIAFTQADALVVDDYYKQGKAINQDLRRDRAAAAMGMSVSLRYDPANGRLSGRLLSPGQPVAGPVRIDLIHPTRPAMDIVLQVMPDQDGGFSGKLPMLEQARWHVVVESVKWDWRLVGGWIWPQQHTIRINAGPDRGEG